MSGAIQNQDITIAAGASQVVQIAGQIVDFIASGSAFDVIEVRPDFMQGAAVLKQGQGFDFGAQFTQLLVINKGATAIAGTLVISTSGFRNFRISGDVNVLDGGKSRTLSGSAFMGYQNQAAVAGQYGRIALWNPATNPNRLMVESGTLLASATAQAVVIDFVTAALATVGENGVSKKSAGAVSAAYFTTDTNAGTSALPNLRALSCPANLSQDFTLKEPIVVLPGNGLVMWSSTVNAFIGAGFEWYEEPNT